MAIYHYNMHSLKCGTGKSALARASYVSASKLHSERTGESFDYSKKENVLFTGLIFPDSVQPMSREKLWNKVESKITTDGRCYAKTGDFALPNEWTLEECKEYTEEFFKKFFVSRDHAVDYAIHWNEGNHHVDYIVPQLRFDEHGELVAPKIKTVFANDKDEDGKFIFNPEKPSYDPKNKETARYRIPVIDEKTGEQKTRVRKGKGTEYLWQRATVEDNSLSSRDFLLEVRKGWEEIANSHLAPENHIDCRSLKAQGIDREPQIHISPAVKAMEEKKPGSTEKMKINDEIKYRNTALKLVYHSLIKLQAKMQELRREVILSVKNRFQKPLECEKTEKDIPVWKPEEQKEEVPFFLQKKDKKKNSGSAGSGSGAESYDSR